MIEVLFALSNGLRKEGDHFHVVSVSSLFDQPLIKGSTLRAKTTSLLQDEEYRASTLCPINSLDWNPISRRKLVRCSLIIGLIAIQDKSFY